MGPVSSRRNIGRTLTPVLALAAAFLAAMGSATECLAQTKLPRVGIAGVSSASSVWIPTFERVLADRGLAPGKNIVLDYRYLQGGLSGLDESVRDLVSLNASVIFATSAPALRAAYAATHSIPIVAWNMSDDPVAAGYAESYARPGKTVTGVFLDAPELAGKWLEILKALVPGLSRVAVLWDPSPGTVHRRGVELAAKSIGVQLQIHELRTEADIERISKALPGRPQAMVILPSPLFYTHSARLAELALKQRLPATSIFRAFSEAGGAVSYGPENTEGAQRAAAMVAKILEGTKPGDIPIERPTKFEFLLNMKTIKALGLTVPGSLLLGAEQVNR